MSIDVAGRDALRRELRKPVNPASKRFRPPILDAPKTPGVSAVIDLIALVSQLVRGGRQAKWISDALTDDQLAELRQKDHAVRTVCADLRIDSPDVEVGYSLGFCRIPFLNRARWLFVKRPWIEEMLTLLEKVRHAEARRNAYRDFSPKQLKTIYGVLDFRAVRGKIKRGELRAKCINSKTYRVAISSLPPDWKSRLNS